MYCQGQEVHVDKADAKWYCAKPSGIIVPSAVEVWRIAVPSCLNSIAELYSVLQPEEQGKAALFTRDEDRQRFIISRGILRMLLGKYSDRDPRHIEYGYGIRDKPFLKHEKADLHFNLSHAGDYILIAVAEQPLGVDIEYYNPDYELREMMQLVFSDEEIVFAEQQADLKPVFYQLWTRKEALLKALSVGINDDLRAIPCLEGRHFIRDIHSSPGSWKVRSFEVDKQYTGSIACQQKTGEILFKLYE